MYDGQSTQAMVVSPPTQALQSYICPWVFEMSPFRVCLAYFYQFRYNENRRAEMETWTHIL